MTKIKYIIILINVGLSTLLRGQQIANYISNGSFEDSYNCNSNSIYEIKYWSDSTCQGSSHFSYCNGFVPNQFNTEYQLPRTGNTFIGTGFYYTYISDRRYLKNRLKTFLQSGKTYCVKFYVNIMNTTTYGNDGFGIYFGNNSLDTITTCTSARYYLNPQVKCPNGVPITDTLGWTLVTGTFVANGTEKYAMIGIFKPNGMVDTVLINPTYGPYCFTDACIDDVSCIPIDLGAYAGPDAFCIPGNSVYIGRQQDVGIDEACMWYKLPNMTTAIDTAAGTWVTPTSPTTTYVVKQDICGIIKYDTVIVYQSGVGFEQLQMYSDKINLSPNPTADNLNISFLQGISQIIITNSLGQIVREQEVDPKNNQINLPTSDLKSGLYQIHFKYTFGSATKKFVKTD